MREMELLDYRYKIDNAIKSAGTAFDIGCNVSDIDAISIQCKKLNSDKPICFVSKWQWWDLELPSGSEMPDSLLPAIIYSGYLITDTSGRFSPGRRIRTSPLVRLHNDYIFESENTLYVLIGSGIRKNVGLNIAFPLGFSVK